MHPSVWHDLNRFKRTKLLDNNWYADPDWFFETSQWFIDNKVAVDVTQGFDIRLITPEIAAQLKKLKRWAPFHFAFDDMAIKDDVLNGLEILKQAGFDTKHHLSFYVYCHNDKQYPDAVERCQILKAHRTTAFAMCNIDRPRSKRMDKLMRWTGRSWLFWSCDIDDYDGKVKGHVGMQAEGLA
jgi:hypothetical protein